MAKSKNSPADSPQPDDPSTQVSSIPPKVNEPEAQAAGTAQAVDEVETASTSTEVPKNKQRVETYEATAPDGSTVTVEHNIDTGESSIKGK